MMGLYQWDDCVPQKCPETIGTYFPFCCKWWIVGVDLCPEEKILSLSVCSLVSFWVSIFSFLYKFSLVTFLHFQTRLADTEAVNS